MCHILTIAITYNVQGEVNYQIDRRDLSYNNMLHFYLSAKLIFLLFKYKWKVSFQANLWLEWESCPSPLPLSKVNNFMQMCPSNSKVKWRMTKSKKFKVIYILYDCKWSKDVHMSKSAWPSWHFWYTLKLYVLNSEA